MAPALKKKRQKTVWTPAMQQYVIDHYVGTEPSEKARGVLRRVFLWDDGKGNLISGNLTAFAEQFSRYFGVAHTRWTFTTIDKILVARGDRVRPFGKRGRQGQSTGRTPPEAESHIVGKAKRLLIAELLVRVYSDGSHEVMPTEAVRKEREGK